LDRAAAESRHTQSKQKGTRKQSCGEQATPQATTPQVYSAQTDPCFFRFFVSFVFLLLQAAMEPAEWSNQGTHAMSLDSGKEGKRETKRPDHFKDQN
jgi:hypothetical protein